MKILLVVHDVAVLHEYTSLLVTAREFELVAVNSKRRALDLARSIEFDRVIVHGHVTDATGPQVIRALKSLPRPLLVIGVPADLTFPRQVSWKKANPDALLHIEPDGEIDHLELLKALGINPAVPTSR